MVPEIINKTIIDPDQVEVIHNGPLTVWQLLPRSESPIRSLALIHLDGENHRVENGESSALYMIIGGIGYFTVWTGDSPEPQVVRAGDFVKIPARTPYKDVGANLLMVSMNRPAFDANKVTVLDETN